MAKTIDYFSPKKLSAWRKVSLASWKPTGDSSCYCLEDITVDELLHYCKATGISFYSFLIKALSSTIQKHPKINSTVRWHRIYPRKNISIFFHTIQSAEADDLSGIVIKDAEKRDLQELNTEFSQKLELAKQGINEYVNSKKIIGALPAFLTKAVTKFYGFLAYTFNWNAGFFKAEPDAYGSVMLTSVGAMGISKALCPISPYTRVPMVVSVGKIEARPIVIDEQIVIRKMITFGFTFDHRIMDGIHFAEFFDCLKNYVLNPNTLVGYAN